MAARKKIAVAGATGRVGRPLVELLRARGHDVVPMSRSLGVDVITGDGLAEALEGVEAIVDVATGPSPEEGPATEFFTRATHNLQEFGAKAGVRQIVVVSIIATDKFESGYGAAKVAHEQAMLAGPLPARILRAAQFHELVGQLVEWGAQGDVSYVPKMRSQLVAASAVAEVAADLATGPEPAAGAPIVEVAGPREESLVDVATRLVAKRGDTVKIVGVSDPDGRAAEVYESGGMLPGPGANLAGPTFDEWLATTF